MFNLFSFLKNMTLSKKEVKRKRVFVLWDEIEECEQAYKHNKKLGEEMLALAQQVDDSDLPFTEKITKKRYILMQPEIILIKLIFIIKNLTI